VCCSTCYSVCCSMCCSVLQGVHMTRPTTTCPNSLHGASHCSPLQPTATHRNTPQHTTTHVCPNSHIATKKSRLPCHSFHIFGSVHSRHSLKSHRFRVVYHPCVDLRATFHKSVSRCEKSRLTLQHSTSQMGALSIQPAPGES